MKKIFWIAAALALAGICTTSCTEEELPGADATTSPLAGTLHIGSLTLDGASTTSTTTRGWREATGEVSTRAITDDGNTTESGMMYVNFIPSNRIITALSKGDRLTIQYNFGGEKDYAAITTFDGDAWGQFIDYAKGTPITPKPAAADESWAAASIERIEFYAERSENDKRAEEASDQALASALENTGKKWMNITRQTDFLAADADDDATAITLDHKPGSTTLGRITAKLTHGDALLRLPANAIRIAEYGEDFGTLQELLAEVGSIRYRFTPVTTPAGEEYWQAIVPDSFSYFTYTLKGFIAIIGPEGGNPGANTFKADKGDDGNILGSADYGVNYTPMKPITITLPEGVTMERNTRYPLTLSLSPHTATVTVGSSAPGWGTEEDEEIIPSLIWTEEEKAAGIRKIGKGQGGQGYYEVISEAGLRTFADIVNGTGQYSSNPKPAASCILTADINLAGVTWTPIGTNGDGYTGTFDGSGHTISNLTVGGREQDVQGLFGSITNATVKNLTIKDGKVTGFYYIGAIAGSATNSTIENCHNLDVTINTQGGAYAGGIVGYTTATTLTACTNTGSVSGTSNIGGIVGWNRSALTACVNTGSVNGTTYAGSIVGWHSNYILTACFWLAGTATDGGGTSKSIPATADAAALAAIADALTNATKDKGYKFTVVPVIDTEIKPGTPLFTVTATQP